MSVARSLRSIALPGLVVFLVHCTGGAAPGGGSSASTAPASTSSGGSVDGSAGPGSPPRATSLKAHVRAGKF